MRVAKEHERLLSFDDMFNVIHDRINELRAQTDGTIKDKIVRESTIVELKTLLENLWSMDQIELPKAGRIVYVTASAE